MTSRSNQAAPANHRPYAPPRYHNYIPSSSSSSSSSASLKGCYCCLFLLLTFLALLAVAFTVVIVLAIRPHKPQFDLNQVSVQYLLVAPSATASAAAAVAPQQPPFSSAYLSLNISLIFTAENPNKVGIRYGESLFYVMYRGVPLGVAVVPGFEQTAHSIRLVESKFSVDHVDVTQADALELVRDATMNDRVDLRITGDVAAKIRLLGLTSPRVQVSVDCAIAISPRRQSVTDKRCGVDGLNV